VGRNRRAAAGITLAEIMVAMVLLVIVGTIVYLLFRQTGRGADIGNLQIEIQSTTRNILNQVSSEMKQGVLLPNTQPGVNPISSVVIWPDPYTAADNNSTTGGTDRNRLIFSSLAGSPSQAGYRAAEISNYRFVEYRVMRDRENRAVLARLVYPASDPASSSRIRGMSYAGGRWNVNLNAFRQSDALLVQILHQLPYSKDNITLAVSHAPKVDPLYGTSYDRNLFKLQVTVERFLHGNDQDKRGFTLEAMVTTSGR